MSTFHLRSFTGIQEHLNVNLWSIESKRRRGLLNKYRCLKEVQSGMTKKGRPNEGLWNEFNIKNLHLSSPGSGIHRLISTSEVEYCTFHEGSKILHSVRWYQYCGMAKQPEEGGIWDGERTGASFGTGTRFRHEGGVAVTRWYNLHWIHPGRSCSCAVSLQRWHPAWQPTELRLGDVQEVGAGNKHKQR